MHYFSTLQNIVPYFYAHHPKFVYFLDIRTKEHKVLICSYVLLSQTTHLCMDALDIRTKKHKGIICSYVLLSQTTHLCMDALDIRTIEHKGIICSYVLLSQTETVWAQKSAELH